RVRARGRVAGGIGRRDVQADVAVHEAGGGHRARGRRGGGGVERPGAARIGGGRVRDRAARGRRDRDGDRAVGFAGADQDRLGVAGQVVGRRRARVVGRIVLQADGRRRGGVVFRERPGGRRAVARGIGRGDLQADVAVDQAARGQRARGRGRVARVDRPVAAAVGGCGVGDRRAGSRRHGDGDGAVGFAGADQDRLGVAGEAVGGRRTRVVGGVVLQADGGRRRR